MLRIPIPSLTEELSMVSDREGGNKAQSVYIGTSVSLHHSNRSSPSESIYTLGITLSLITRRVDMGQSLRINLYMYLQAHFFQPIIV
jgi:hypothetical protein